MLIILFLALFLGSSAQVANRFKRVIVMTYDVDFLQNSIAGILNPNLDRTVASGLQTRAQANQTTSYCLQSIIDLFGIDFSAGYFDPTEGIYALPFAELIPYGTGLEDQRTYQVLSDDRHPLRGSVQGWSSVYSGYAGFFLTNGVFPGGTSAGLSYQANDFVVCLDWWMVRDGSDWTRYWNQEHNFVFSNITTKEPVNSYGQTDQYSPCIAQSEDDGLGLYMASFSAKNFTQGGQLYQQYQGRTVVTWYK